MKMSRVTNKQAVDAIKARVPFSNATGSFRGQWGPSNPHSPHSRFTSNPAETEFYVAGKSWGSGMYVVFSYDTPIAWWTPTGLWTVPEIKYSQTTGRHQSRVRQAVNA